MNTGGKAGIDVTKKWPGAGFKCTWPPLIRMNDGENGKLDALIHFC